MKQSPVRFQNGKWYAEVNGKRVPAKSREDALSISGGGASSSTGSVAGKKSQTDIQKEQGFAANTAEQQIKYGNPNQTDAYGNSQTTTLDENGNPVVNQQFSQGNQGIANANTDISQFGRNIARGTLQGIQNGDPNALAPEYSQGNLEQDRSRIEGQVYNRLTANTEKDYAQQKAQRAQQLADSGNPVGSPLYNQEMGRLEQEHNDARLAASQTAVGMGGDQYTQMFNANQTQRQNQIGNIGAFSNMGPGLQGGQFTGFQPGQYNPGVSPFGIKQGNAQIKQGQSAVDIAMQQLNRRNSGGGGGTPPATPSPFG